MMLGQFYIGNKKLWLSKNIHSNSRGFLLPRLKSVDLDTKDDLNLLKFFIFKKKRNEKKIAIVGSGFLV